MIKLNTKKLLIITLITVLSIGLFGCTKNTEGLVAEVNGEPITEEEFNEDFQVFKNLYERQLGEDALEQVGQDGKTQGETLKESILEKLIMEKLVAKEAEEMDISITDEEVDEQMGNYVRDMGGQENFDEFLIGNDISKEFFEANLRKELLVDKHKVEFLKGVTVTDEEAKSYFNENKEALIKLNASHILVGSEEEGKAILERLENGEDFAAVAILESLDSVTAAQGGELPYFTRGSMIAEFEDAAFALEEGETSDLVKTEVGYHVIYIKERKDTYEELKDEIILGLKDEQYLASIQELRESAKVEKYLDKSEE